MSAAREKLRVATRGSRLAMAQTQAVLERIRRLVTGVEVEVVPIRTRGDQVSARWAEAQRPAAEDATADMAVGAFVKELEHALLDGRCDLAVHSLKDVPTKLPDGLTLAAFPEREDPRDVLVMPSGSGAESKPGDQADPGDPVRNAGSQPAGKLLAALLPGARIGTASLRRSVQLRLIRSDIRTLAVRGNVETRLRRLDEGLYDALALAAAGLVRLGLSGRLSGWFEPDQLVPAPGQGILAIECRADDTRVLEWLAPIDRAEVRAEAAAERSFMARTEAGCRWPVGARARLEGSTLELIGFVALPEGAGGANAARWLAARGRCRLDLSGRTPGEWVEEARRAGEALAEQLLDRIRAGEGAAVEADGGV